MKREDIRGPAYAPMHSIEAVVQEMLGYIRERMRLTPSQVQLLEPVVRRAVHQIARKMEIQPLIYGRELTEELKRAKAAKLGPRNTAEEWINRQFGPGWIIRQGKGGTHTLIAMCRASFFALLDEYKAQQAKKDELAKAKAMTEAAPTRKKWQKQREKLPKPTKQEPKA